MIKSLTRVKHIGRVFNDPTSLLDAHVARLCVLFEDLRIETYGIIEDTLPLDFTSEAYRRNYFLRRSIATVVEIAEEIRLLDELELFERIKSSFEGDSLKNWNKAVTFFRRYESFFELVRNDIGGHFGLKAARYALTDLPNTVGVIQIVRGGNNGAGVKLKFAGEIVVSAMFRHKGRHTDNWYLHRLLRLTRAGYRHGIKAINAIAAFYLWDELFSGA